VLSSADCPHTVAEVSVLLLDLGKDAVDLEPALRSNVKVDRLEEHLKVKRDSLLKCLYESSLS